MRYIKLSVVLLVLLNVWLLWHVPAVANAVLMFCVGGAVPGTHIILSPNVVYATCAGLFIFAAAAIIGRTIVHSFRVSGELQNQNMVDVPNGVEPLVLPVRIAHVELMPRMQMPAMVSKQYRYRTVPKLQTYQLQRVQYGFFLGLTVVYAYTAVTIILWMQFAVGKVRAAAPYIVCASLFIWRTIITAALLLQAAWRYIEPYLRRFDHWLDVQLHSNSKSSKIIKVCDEFVDLCVVIMRAAYRQLKLLLKTLYELWQTSANRK